LRQVLTERRAAILQLIIDDYVRSATPVGSENIVRTHRLELSPATLRNEMARLEEDGYISHPHTSAGRVPSDKGYRYYVETLMQDTDIPHEEKLRILHQFHQSSMEMSEWLQLAVVTAPRMSTTKLKHVQLVELSESTALMVLVTEDIKVQQQVVTLQEPIGQEELNQIAARMNQRLAGKGAEGIRAELEGLTPIEELLYRLAADMLAEEDAAQYAEPHLEGIANVLRQPEFSRSDRMLDVVEALEERNLGKVIPFETVGDDGVTVIIGAENRQDAMRDCSVVIARYSAGENGPAGAIAVLGPTRMHYPRSIATVRYLRELMSDLMGKLYGENH
jgi:heat-inducible transcriptional repressor